MVTTNDKNNYLMAHEQKTHTKKTLDSTLVYYTDEKSHVPLKTMFTQVKTYLQK